jgi:hypothetical protein
MFRVEYVPEWKIVDENDKVVFVGTMRQAEDWLDFRENAQRQTLSTGVWLRNLVATGRPLLARLFADRPPPNPVPVSVRGPSTTDKSRTASAEAGKEFRGLTAVV